MNLAYKISERSLTYMERMIQKLTQDAMESLRSNRSNSIQSILRKRSEPPVYMLGRQSGRSSWSRGYVTEEHIQRARERVSGNVRGSRSNYMYYVDDDSYSTMERLREQLRDRTREDSIRRNSDESPWWLR